MKTKEYKTVDKSEWQRGPWDSEPDKIQFVDEATGFPCLIVRGPSGSLCGYVGVSSNHPDFGKNYDDVHIDVHGGLTFANSCSPNADESRHICHVVEEGEDDNVWWFGFDCAHLGDRSPAYERHYARSFEGDTYKDVSYVKAEIAGLANQLKARQP